MDMEIGLSLSSIALLMCYTMSTDKPCHTHARTSFGVPFLCARVFFFFWAKRGLFLKITIEAKQFY